MGRYLLLFLIGVSAVCGNVNVGGPTIDGTLLCDWVGKIYNETDTISYTFKSNDGKDLLLDKAKKASVKVVNSSSGYFEVILSLKVSYPSDVQNYSCELKIGSDELVKTTPLRARPIPRGSLLNKTVTRGDSFTLDCSFASASNITVTKYTFESTATGVVSLMTATVDGIQLNQSTNTIWIASVRNEHRGFYSCEGVNEYGETNIRVRLRVKSPLAALWPAIGILIEVLVLIVVVIVYERRRAAQKDTDAPIVGDEDEENGRAHNAGSSANSMDKQKNSDGVDVRQRAAKA